MTACSGCPKQIRAAGNKTGMCADCVKKARAGAAPPPPAGHAAEGFSDNGDTGTAAALTDRDVRTLDELVAVCKVDTATWEVERFVCNKWAMGSKHPKTGDVTVTPLFQVKAWLRRKTALISLREEVAAVLADARSQVPAPRIGAYDRGGGGHSLLVSIPDLHVGKLAWAPETGGASYDARIAEGLYLRALERLVQRTCSFPLSEIVLPLGNDLINVDNRELLTTRGTPQSSDGRYHKTFRTVRRMVQQGIALLREIAPVRVVVVPGNHDTLSMWHLGELLELSYSADPSVMVDNDPILRKYHRFGRNMWMFLHGDKGKKPNYPQVMARERPQMWGETEHREVHTGHLHQTQVQEFHGTKVLISPALCPPDAWHSENLYVGNARAAEAFVYHEEEGRVASATFTVQEAR
jgi:hypothetical protein